VFTIGADPVKFGLVASLNRPGGNITGVSFLANALVAKQMELLRELVPTASEIDLLVNPNNPNAESDAGQARAAANSLGCKISAGRSFCFVGPCRLMAALVGHREIATSLP
jgi:putative ABC transport system substrate-binding protein